jgi:hypothetical protein
VTHGNMDFDYRRRCVVKVSLGDIEYDRIYYGLTAREYQPIFEDGGARDLPSPYAELSIGGKRPNGKRTDDGVNKKHFFNKRIRTQDEIAAAEIVRVNRNTVSVASRYGSLGPSGSQEAVPRERSAGSGGATAEQEEVTS